MLLAFGSGSYVLLSLNFSLKGFEFKGRTTEKCSLITELWKAEPQVNPRMPCVVLVNQDLEPGLFPGSGRRPDCSQQGNGREAEHTKPAGQNCLEMGSKTFSRSLSQRALWKRGRKGRSLNWREPRAQGRRQGLVVVRTVTRQSIELQKAFSA